MSMKKIVVLFVLLCSMTALLTSCQVNWFGKHYEVSWWVIAVPVVVFSAIVWIVAGKHIASKKYVCPKCNQTFNPKWWRATVSIHMNDDRVFKCPHCGRKGFCHVSKETED